MTAKILGLPSLLLTLAASPLAAQARRPAPAASVLFRPAPTEQVQDTVKVDDGLPQREGMLIGMIAGAGVGYFVGMVLEGQGGCPAGGGCGEAAHPESRVIGAALFGVAGMLIGGSAAGPHTPKLQHPEVTEPAHQDSGMKWWQGGVIGAGVGALGAAFLNYGLHAGHGLEVTDDQSVVVIAPLGALLGFFVGGSLSQVH
jgi:hypothetical protein